MYKDIYIIYNIFTTHYGRKDNACPSGIILFCIFEKSNVSFTIYNKKNPVDPDQNVRTTNYSYESYVAL